MKLYQVMPDLSAEDYAALKADIAARGVLVPVEFDDGGNVLDGHHRVRACQELGITEWPKVTRSGLTEAQKREHARQLNIARRHLSSAQKRALIAEQLKDTPERSNRQIAGGLGVDHKTVATVRDDLGRRGEIPHVSKTVDKSGRYQQADRPPKRGAGSSEKPRRDVRRVVLDPEFRAEAEARARDLEIERDERIALAGADALEAENKALAAEVQTLTRRINALRTDNDRYKQLAKMWEKRARAAGWKGQERADA